METQEMLLQTATMGASDLHITVASPPICRLHGKLLPLTEQPLMPVDTRKFITDILDRDQWEILNDLGEIDLSISVQNRFRFRVNCYKQKDLQFSFTSLWAMIPTKDAESINSSIPISTKRDIVDIESLVWIVDSTR